MHALQKITYAQYLMMEEGAELRHEWLDGAVFAMASGTLDHATLISNVLLALGLALRGGPCRVFTGDARVRVRATGLATYPDASVICGPRETHPEDPQALTNPRLLVEVLSPSTEVYDRTEKLDHYRQIEALEDVLLVDHRCVRAERWTRAGRGWTVVVHGPGERLSLGGRSPDHGPVELDVDAIYAGVDLPPAARATAVSRSSAPTA
jgi:Uma2 family endonuclease